MQHKIKNLPLSEGRWIAFFPQNTIIRLLYADCRDQWSYPVDGEAPVDQVEDQQKDHSKQYHSIHLFVDAFLTFLKEKKKKKLWQSFTTSIGITICSHNAQQYFLACPGMLAVDRTRPLWTERTRHGTPSTKSCEYNYSYNNNLN